MKKDAYGLGFRVLGENVYPKQILLELGLSLTS